MKRAILIALTLAIASPLFAQQMVTAPTGTIFGRVDFGLQPVSLDRDSSKFNEYREVPDGGFIPMLRIFGDEALQYDLVAENVRQDDARYRLRVGTPLFRVNIDYNQIPHRFGNDARTLYEPLENGMLRIDDAIQRHCQTEVEQQWAKSKPGINFAFLRDVMQPHLSTANVIDVGLTRKRGLVELRMPAGSPYDVRVTYFQENRNGSRPYSTSFGFSDSVESPEPIDYETRELATTAEFPFRRGLLRGSVQYNEFSNALPSVMFDNPWRITDATDASAYAAPGSGSIGGAAVGRISLPPGNRSVTGSIGGLYRLPMDSRFTADLSVSRWRQNETFIPYTTNTAITSPFNAFDPASLPATSLDGEMNIVSSLFTFQTQPTRRLSLMARYKTYDLSNDTPRIELPGYTRFDAVWEEIPRISVPYAFSTNRGDVTVGYDIGAFTLEGGYRYERWDRKFRETRETTEGIWRGAVDWKLRSWALVRTSYEIGSRNLDHYDPQAAHASFQHPEDPNNIPTLRRYDQAAKDINRVSALLQLTPRGDMMVSLNYLSSEDDFTESEHGLLNASSRSLTAEADWTPSERWNVYGFYTRESLSSLQRDRQSGATVSTDPRNDWTAELTNDVESYGLGGTLAVVPDKFTLRLLGRYQDANGNNAMDSPPGGTPDLAFGIAEFDDFRLWSASAEVDYQLNRSWSIAVGAWREDYRFRDAANTGLSNYMPGTLFLAPNAGDYRGNALYIRTSYRM